jgi:hypothetical protein
VAQELEQTSTNTGEDDGPLWSPVAHRRFLLAFIAVLCVVLLVVLPPYISLNRYQRRVATAISGALGRPVHFDRISLHLLPLPGLTIENFVVSESPEFGSEPVLRADIVEARLRFASLWRRRIEVSRISLDAPSVNLVRRPDTGTWNLQGIVMQASQMNSAPTAQRRAGPSPRFPYIEATDARINIKNGIDKLPFSVKEADFALWLPEPGEWRVRLSGRPVRTDTDVSDVGLLRVEATLGRANDLVAAPIDLTANWKPTPLGEAAKLTAGYDLGWRGAASADASLHGTIGSAKLTADAHLRNLRRADFYPDHTLDVDAHCEAVTSGLLRSLQDIRCAVPTSSDTSILGIFDGLRNESAAGDETTPGVLRVAGELPNLLDWRTAALQASMKAAKPAYALAWMRLFSSRIPRDIHVDGTLSLVAGKPGTKTNWTGLVVCACLLTPPPEANPTPAAAQTASTTSDTHKPLRWTVELSHAEGADPLSLDGAIAVTPESGAKPGDVENGAEEALADGKLLARIELTRSALTMVYTSAETARTAAQILPFLADNLPEDASGTIRSARTWSGFQAWTLPTPPRTRPTARRHR